MARRAKPQLLVVENEADNKLQQPKPSNHLKLRIDDLKTFEPLTDNQKKFFDAYKIGDYFIAFSEALERFCDYIQDFWSRLAYSESKGTPPPWE